MATRTIQRGEDGSRALWLAEQRELRRGHQPILSAGGWYALAALGVAAAGAYGLHRAGYFGAPKAKLLVLENPKYYHDKESTTLFFTEGDAKSSAMKVDKDLFDGDKLTDGGKKLIDVYIKNRLASELANNRKLFSLLLISKNSKFLHLKDDKPAFTEFQINAFSDYVLASAQEATGWTDEPEIYRIIPKFDEVNDRKKHHSNKKQKKNKHSAKPQNPATTSVGKD